jgi:hypothetical protein
MVILLALLSLSQAKASPLRVTETYVNKMIIFVCTNGEIFKETYYIKVQSGFLDSSEQ